MTAFSKQRQRWPKALLRSLGIVVLGTSVALAESALDRLEKDPAVPAWAKEQVGRELEPYRGAKGFPPSWRSFVQRKKLGPDGLLGGKTAGLDKCFPDKNGRHLMSAAEVHASAASKKLAGAHYVRRYRELLSGPHDGFSGATEVDLVGYLARTSAETVAQQLGTFGVLN